MRVVMMGDFPRDPERIGGGVEAVIVYLLKGLQQFDDLELQVLTLRPDVAGEKMISHNGVTAYYLPANYRLNALTFDAHHRHLLRRKLMSLRPDLIHAHIAGIYPLAALGTDIPSVLTLHGIRRHEMALWRGWRSQIYRRWLVAWQERVSARAARHIISISPYVRKEFGQVLQGAIYDIENPVQDHFFALERREEPNRILYVGHISVRKGILELLQAMDLVRQQVTEVQLRLAGRTNVDQDYTEQAQAFVRERCLEKNVRFLGPLDEESLLEEYAHCALLVLASRQETAPMVIEQAMAARVPVVATRVGGVDYLVDHGRTGFVVEFGNIEKLAEAMIRLLADADLRTSMGEAGRFEAECRFRADIVARQTRQVYYRILGRALPSGVDG